MKRRERNYINQKKFVRLFNQLHNDYIGRIEKAVFRPFYYITDAGIVESDSAVVGEPVGEPVTITISKENHYTH